MYYFINRHMVPWIIAVICYFLVNIKVYNYDCSLKALIMNFISPFCHLWYIPAIIFYSFTFYVMIRLLHNTKCCWIIIGGISLLICMISYYIEHNYLYGHKVLSILHNNLRLYNFIYFSSGALLKKILLSEDNKIQNIKFVKIISFCLFLFYLLFYFF